MILGSTLFGIQCFPKVALLFLSRYISSEFSLRYSWCEMVAHVSFNRAVANNNQYFPSQFTSPRRCLQQYNPIPIASKTICLGFTLIAELTWKAHIEDVLKNIGPYLKVLRILSSTEWGSDPAVAKSEHRENSMVPLIMYSSKLYCCLLYTSPSPRDRTRSRMPSSA